MFTHNYQKGRYKSKPETNNGQRLVEKQGYISAQKRIENLMLAGQRLNIARKEQFDFPDGNIDENVYDPTRRKDYDLAEAFQDSQRINSRLKASQNAQEARRDVKNIKDDVEDIEIKKSFEEAIKP